MLFELCAAQTRLTPMGEVQGFDAMAVLSMGDALGVDRKIVAMFLGNAERGIIEGQRKRKGGSEILGG